MSALTSLISAALAAAVTLGGAGAVPTTENATENTAGETTVSASAELSSTLSSALTAPVAVEENTQGAPNWTVSSLKTASKEVWNYAYKVQRDKNYYKTYTFLYSYPASDTLEAYSQFLYNTAEIKQKRLSPAQAKRNDAAIAKAKVYYDSMARRNITDPVKVDYYTDNIRKALKPEVQRMKNSSYWNKLSMTYFTEQALHWNY